MSVSTVKPLRKHKLNVLPTARPTVQSPITSISGNREGRHFRNSNPRSQNSAEKTTTASTDISTTKKPIRTYYFEPKRRRSKDPNAEFKSKL